MNDTIRGVVRTAVVVLAVAGPVGGCAVNPVTGERQLALISEAQEIQMGRDAALQVERSLGLVDDDSLQAYVHRLGTRLAAVSERPELPWSFRVVEDPTPNAFALPGGFIFLTRGMMNLMDSEAELVSVLGHEIGHVTARHSVTQISRAQLAQLGLGIGGILVPELQPFGDLLGGGLSLLFLKYGRDAERQADELGFKYSGQTGYDVSEMADVFAALQALGEREGGSSIPGWLATHPAPAERIEAVEARLAQRQITEGGPGRLGRAEYLRHIDGLVYGENPRNGFFREGVFYHPDLRFRFAVPADWRTQNMAQAVQAMSPQQNAMVQLTLVPGASAAQALQGFGTQQGVQLARASRETINGIPAAIAAFQGQTQQGVLQGYVAFLEYEGRTYQVVTYTSSAQFGSYAPLFRQVIGSFAPLTDPAILGVRPPRIEIVRIPRTMTLAEFAREYPSTIPLPELAILNQAQGEATTFEAGTMLKRVVAE